MATSNPFPPQQLPKLSPPGTAESGAELPSLRRSPPAAADIYADGRVPVEQPTHPISADDSVVRPAPEPGLSVDEGINADASSPFAPQPRSVLEITARYRGRIGQYQIKNLADQPGLGLAFLAEDVNRHRPVTLRVIKRNRSPGDPVWAALLEGVRAATAVKSPHIATVHEVGEDQGVLYVATELLSGESLESRLLYESLPLLQALRVVRETAVGLTAAHDAGFVHYDIKPAKLWLLGTAGNATARDQPAVKILDFGQVNVECDEFGQLRRGPADGCHAYLAPEQARGELGSVRADLFSLGVLLFRLVTGGLPLPGDAPMSTRMVSSTDRRLPASLVNLTNQLLSPDPDARPRSAAQVVAAVRTIERELVNRRRDRRTLQVGAGILSVLLITAGVITVWNWLGSAADAPVPPTAAKPGASGLLAPHQVTTLVGERVRVEFRVARIERLRDGVTHIYASDPQLKDEQFRLVVPFAMPKVLMDTLTQRGLLQAGTAGGQTVRASGTVIRDGDIAEIMIRDLTQIEN